MKSQLSIKTAQQLQNQYLKGYAAPDLFELLLDTELSIEEMLEPVQPLKSATLPKKAKGCRCSKNRCGNGYCECFSNRGFCGSECQCQGCGNREFLETDLQPAVSFAEISVKKFRKKGSGQKRGCNCKRSGCDKRYCECYSRGSQCDQNCTCIACANTSALANVF